MADRYPIPAGEARIEFTMKRSLFIGSAGPAAAVAEAEAFIQKTAAAFPEANHHAWAYLIGFGTAAIHACHNAGEPGGTAGAPALATLRASGLGDAVVVVSRYFGGVKLGAGGLTRAYARAAREAINALPRAERIVRCTITVTAEYRFHDALRRLLPYYEAHLIAINYGSAVRLTLALPVDRLDEFKAGASELTAGLAHIAVEASL